MDYVDGVDLRELLRREGRLEPERALHLVRQAGEALDAAHAAGLVHRDVKPGNILVVRRRRGVRLRLRPRAPRLVGRQPHRRPRLRRHRRLRRAGADPRREDRRPRRRLRARLRAVRVPRGRAAVRARERAGGRVRASERAAAAADRSPARAAHRLGRRDRAGAREGAGRPLRRRGALAAAADDALHGRAAPRRRSRWLLAGAAAATVAIAAGAIGTVLAVEGDSPPAAPAAEQPLVLGAVDATTGRTLASIRSGTRFGYGHAPQDVVVAGHSAWLLLPSEQRLLRVDTRTRKLRAAIRLPWVPLWRLTAADGYVWAAQDGGPELARISTATGRLTRFRPQNAPTTGMSAGDGVVWVATDGLIGRVLPGNGSSGNNIPYDGSGRITSGDGAIWSLEDVGTIRKLDPRTGRRLARIDLHATVSDVAVGGGLRLGGDRAGRRRLRAGRDRPARAAQARDRPGSGAHLVRGGTALGRERRGRHRHVASSRARARASASRSAASRPRWPTATARPGPERCPSRRRFRRPAGPSCGSRFPGEYLTLDPGVSHSDADEQLEEATCAGLLAYADTAGPAGKGLRPEVAAAMPRVSADGRTYTFRIRTRLPLLAAVERAGDGGDVQAHARARLLTEARPRRARPERGARDRRARAVPRRQGGARLRDQGARRTRSRSRS